MIEPGKNCPLCSGGVIKHKFHTIGEVRFENLQCDMCAARYCLVCKGTLNIRGSSSKHPGQCACEDGEDLVDKNFVLTDEDLESEEG